MEQKLKLDIFRFVKPVLPFYILVIFINIVFVGLDMLSPQISMHIVDDVLIGKDMTHLEAFLFALLGIGILRALLGYTREFCCDWAGSQVGMNVRKDFFTKIQTLSANFFDKMNSGELMSRLFDDGSNIWGLFTYIGMLLSEVIVHVSFIMFCMFRMNWRLALIPAVSMLICAAIALTMEKHLGPVFEEIGQETQVLNNTAQENLNAVRTVKSFVREKFEIEKFSEHNKKYYSLNYRISRIFVRYHPLLQMFRYLVPIAILIAGGFSVMKDNLTLGELTAFVQYSMNIVWPMEMLGWLTSGFSQGKASIKRIDKIYNEIPQIAEKAETLDKKCAEIKGNIKYEHVCFNSESGTPILKDVSFSIDAGQTLGIMGATGSGKTTLVNLLKRMYDVSSGSITIDGIDIRDMSLKQLRRAVSIVMQDVFLFSETINGNVKLGEKETLLEEAVKRAMDDSASNEFVLKMEDGAETVVGERGVGLSGGQKQRLTMARAMSRNAPVIVFDDSTSALDAETEKKVQHTLNDMHGMTKIIIAHRISSVKNADKIIVLEDGRIAEEGTHEELLARHGLYYETYVTQYGENNG